MSKFKFVQWYGIVVCLLMAACTDVDITMPKGPKGDTGLSAYEFWKEKVADGTVDWPKDRTEVADFFKYLKGNDGKDPHRKITFFRSASAAAFPRKGFIAK